MEMSLDPMGGLVDESAPEPRGGWRAPEWEDFNPADVRYGYHRGMLYYPVTALVRDRAVGTEHRQTLVIRSDGNVLRARCSPLPSGVSVEEGVCRLDDGTLIGSDFRASPCASWRIPSIQRYLRGGAGGRGLGQLVADVEAHLRAKVWLPREDDYVLLALAVAASYSQAMFEAVPLLLVTGQPGSGKSRLGAAMADLGANAPRPVGRGSPASIMRLIDDCRGMTVLDDREDIRRRGRRRADYSDFNQSLKVSYSRATAVKLICSMRSRCPERLCLFGVKVINNTRGADDILGSRMFRVLTAPRPPGIAMPPHPGFDTADLRDEIHTWTFRNVGAIARAYAEICPEITGRGEEIAAPLRALARLAGGDLPARLETALAVQAAAPEIFDTPAAVLGAAVRRLRQGGYRRVCPAHVLLEMRKIVVESGVDGQLLGGTNEAWVGRLMRQMGIIHPGAWDERRRIAGRQVRILDLGGQGPDAGPDPLSFCRSCPDCRYAAVHCPIRAGRGRVRR